MLEPEPGQSVDRTPRRRQAVQLGRAVPADHLWKRTKPRPLRTRITCQPRASDAAPWHAPWDPHRSPWTTPSTVPTTRVTSYRTMQCAKVKIRSEEADSEPRGGNDRKTPHRLSHLDIHSRSALNGARCKQRCINQYIWHTAAHNGCLAVAIRPAALFGVILL